MKHPPKNPLEHEIRLLKRVLRGLKADPTARGRPKRNRLLSETAAKMRQGGASMKQIQKYLGAQLGRPFDDESEQIKFWYRAATRWADSGDASRAAYLAIVAAYRSGDNEGELQLAAARRCAESMIMLNAMADGSIPLVDLHGNVIPRKA